MKNEAAQLDRDAKIVLADIQAVKRETAILRTGNRRLIRAIRRRLPSSKAFPII